MKLLIVGNGGREHTLAWKLSQSKKVEKIYTAPGNAGSLQLGENLDIKADDLDGLLDFAKKEKIDLTIVGPEVPLALGIVDKFRQEGLRIFGVGKHPAQLEGSKDFSKAFMIRNNIPTARYETYTDSSLAKKALKNFNYPLVIKADGLCYGKGVIICEDEAMAIETIDEILEDKVFGDEGNKIVIEEFLDGIEASLLCLVSDNKIFPLEPAEDYKQIYDGDKGPNTGGVGCYSPSSLLNENIYKQVKEDIIKNIEIGFEKEDMNFTGLLFIGLMVVGDKPYVLEFNVRFGDPETQVVLPRLESDLLDLIEKTIDGSLKREDIKWKQEKSLTVILTSGGYPGDYKTGYEITGLDKLDEDILVFHNGTKEKEGKIYTDGGRVLSITCLDSDLSTAREKVYTNIEKIKFKDMYYRKDIGKNIEY